jgi:uncharacterized protein with NRDE domain
MCITFIVRNWKYKFLLLFNRDEYFNRPTIPIGFNYDKDEKYKDQLFFPLDCISGGTFLCLNIKNGNFGLLLNNNYTTIPYNPNAVLKRGDLPIDYCKGEPTDDEYYSTFFKILNQNKELYNGFNLLCGNMIRSKVLYYTNNTENKGKLQMDTSFQNMEEAAELEENLLGLCNACLFDKDSVFSIKTQYGKSKLEKILSEEFTSENEFVKSLFNIMQDDKKLLDQPSISEHSFKEGVKNSKIKDYVVSSIFVKDKIDDSYFEYGTRHTFAILLDNNNILKVYEQFDEVMEIMKNKNLNQLTVLDRIEENIKLHEFKLTEI